jgi:hypothetical protein
VFVLCWNTCVVEHLIYGITSTHGHESRFIIWKIQRVDGGHTYIIKHRINVEINYVKAGRYINRWFLFGETCPYMVNIRGKSSVD